MVQLDLVRASNAALAEQQPLTAVFVGATTGIGEYTLRSVAKTYGKNGKQLCIYLIGRNVKAAEKIFADCERICPSGRFRFIQAGDLALLKDVDAACAELKRVIAQDADKEGEPTAIDTLFMTQGVLGLGPRDDTTEGIERNMSLLYYSRMRFITNLAPLLTTSRVPGHAVSVYAGGMEAKLISNDLSLRDPKNFGFNQRRSHCVYMKTVYMEYLATQYAGKLSLSHVYPGLVVTEAFGSPSLPWWFKIAWKLLGPVISRFVAVSADETGDRMMFHATSSSAYPAMGQSPEITGASKVAAVKGTNGSLGGGAYGLTWTGEPSVSGAWKNVNKEALAQQVIEHTDRAFADIEAGRKYTG